MKGMRLAVAATLMASGVAWAQNPDFRIRADHRTPDNGQWGADESVGHTEFRVTSRFAQVYYGGVLRADEFRFTVQLDFSGISGFDTEFESSPYNSDYDVYISGGFVGRAIMNADGPGVAFLRYDSRH
ncbi:MAG: hypothetical protein KDA32_12580, partial [Phycisphaerales bacterium]|nr:hypothetical protein [Phycisphaerales bacterium]